MHLTVGFVGILLVLAPVWTPKASAQQAGDPTRVTAILPRLEALAQDGLRTTGVPGMAIAVVSGNQVVYLKGLGVRQAGQAQPVDPDTVFQIASCSKPVTTTMLAALIGMGKLGWDDRVIDHDPGFRLEDPWVTRELTVRDLVTHRSGLPAFAGDDLEQLGWDRRAILARLRFLKPASSFRSRHAYTNFAFTESGEVAAQVTGVPYEDVMAELLFRPLGMTATSARFADYERAANKAVPHVLVEGRMVPKYTRRPDAQAPAGGISSTARDMAQWLRLHLGVGTVDGRQIIPADALAETHRPQLVSGFNPGTFGRAGFSGLGWVVEYDEHGRTHVKHSGAFSAGVRSQVALLPAEGVGIVVLSNGFPSGLPEGIVKAFFDLLLTGTAPPDAVTAEHARITAVLERMARAPARPPRAQPATPARPATAYAGVYRSDYFGTLEVVQRDGTLFVLLEPSRAQRPLGHWARDVFTFELPGDSGEEETTALFTVGSDGVATRVVVEGLDHNGVGTFRRVP